MVPKRTYQPKKLRRKRALGFRFRTGSRGGKRVIKKRREKGRRRLSF